MNYTEIDERLDLDNQMLKIAKSYPQNDDDYFMFIRGKNSTNELFLTSIGELHYFGKAIFKMAIDNENFKQEILFCAKAIKEYREEN
jgi:hypothetical protein